ncbi:SLC13 family permease [Ectothiorhodospira marina]|uniref:TrkA-C domain-containing protein n=1 Tax=Ectothiorhodospira marina TaxID=1396821 RepID=A0A1H7MPI8_9GAMM|nr:SLC13 family permease [Ectothiorhodospira marina]SEL13021.1 TrkA-C domain-containing protein [Ectothiorhodospira marina]
MTHEQTLILTILLATISMFLWGRWRHDMVAVGALLACVLFGLVVPAEAFAGFGHPAVITVACVLVLSRGLQLSGAVDVLSRAVLPTRAGPTLSIAALVTLAAVLSGFMNNVGALALLMPVAVQLAGRLDLTPGKVLMPLAFGSILGGTMTLIGTPPNLIVSGFRADREDLGGFAMFDFIGVGLPLALVGVLFIVLIGWRLVPRREQPGVSGFDTGAYTTEARVPEGSKAADMRLHEIESVLDEADAQVIGLIRNEVKMSAPSGGRLVKPGDILVIEAEVEALSNVLGTLGLTLEEADSNDESEDDDAHGEMQRDASQGKDKTVASKKAAAENSATDKSKDKTDEEESDKSAERSDDIVLVELVVRPESSLEGRSAKDILLRSRYGLNMLAVSRDGARTKARLRTLKIRAGDLLLMQGPSDTITEFAADFGCVPLAKRELRIPDKRKAIAATGIMLAAVGVAAMGLLPAAVTFAAGVLASMALRTVPPRSVYASVDWPVIVLLASLLPVAGAMQSTGTADLIAHILLENLAQGHAILGLAVILITTMILTDLMNNAATAAVMAPIGLGAALQLGVNPDTFLMAVAIGASCAFLTPIGHQNNTLILGPGGFRFGDYWRMGLPVDLLVITVSIPLLLLVWPL